LLLDTLRRLNDLQIHFQCHIYGDGEDVDILKSQVNSLALSDQVSILGYISNPSDILSDYDLYLCTSVNGNLGVGGMQALLSDIPVIGIDTLSAGNKPIYYSNNPVTLANYIQSLSFEVQLALYNEHLNSYRNSIISNGRLFNDRYLNLFQSLTSE
jgi:glycosyltransferase involved in cell wall biosynthesis